MTDRDSEAAIMVWLLVGGVGVLLANLAVLALTIKLYTEFAKDRFQSARSGSSTQA